MRTGVEEDPCPDSEDVEEDVGSESRVVMGDDIDRERRDLVRARGGVPGGGVVRSGRDELVCVWRSNWRDVGGW